MARWLDKRWRTAAWALLLVPLLAVAATKPVDTAAADRAFMWLADQYFDTFHLPSNPSAATGYGVHRYDGKLEDYSRTGTDSEMKALRSWEQRIAAVDPASLSLYIRGDRNLVLNNIRSSLLTLQAIRPWEKNPDFYSSGMTSSAFALMERKFAPPETRLRDLISRERQMPAALLAARESQKSAEDLHRNRAGAIAGIDPVLPARRALGFRGRRRRRAGKGIRGIQRRGSQGAG